MTITDSHRSMEDVAAALAKGNVDIYLPGDLGRVLEALIHLPDDVQERDAIVEAAALVKEVLDEAQNTSVWRDHVARRKAERGPSSCAWC